MTTAESEFSALDLDAGTPLTLPASGFEIRVQRLRTRQLFRLLKIITHGAGNFLATIRMDPDEGTEAFIQKMITIIALSLPESEDETIDFLRIMCRPEGWVEGAKDKTTKATNDRLIGELYTYLHNPEMDDALSIIEVIVRNESSDLMSLGKRLGGMVRLAQASGQLPKPAPIPETDESGENDQTDEDDTTLEESSAASLLASI
jgi:hypothetical protein